MVEKLIAAHSSNIRNMTHYTQRTMPPSLSEPNYLELLLAGVEDWNHWRQDNPKQRPDLSEVDLSDLDLTGANLSEVDLSAADLFQTCLRDANLKMAELSGADLSGADLSGAELYKADLTKSFLTGAKLASAYLAEAEMTDTDMRGADLAGADLTGANLRAANLTEVILTGANLANADVTHAVLCYANLSEANVLGLEYGEFSELRGKYFAIRGLDSAFGNALFVRDAQDQDYLDTMENAIERMAGDLKQALREDRIRTRSVEARGRSIWITAA